MFERMVELIMDSFGNVIKNIRKERHLTQKMLSQDICSQSVLSRIENDEELPNVLVMYQLCQRLGITMDQVMENQAVEASELTGIFERIRYYFRNGNYEVVEKILRQPGFFERISLDDDLQHYYYFLGNCDLLHQRYEQAIQHLKQGLSYSFQIEQEKITDIEIEIVSCLGKVYGECGQSKEARYFLEKSIRLYRLLPQEPTHIELVRIFYNYAKFLVRCEEWEKALDQVDFGIALARQKKSFYSLDELFQLKAEIFLSLGDSEQAEKAQQLAQAVAQVAGKINE